MSTKRKVYEREKTKIKILKGSGHKAYNSNKYIEPRSQSIDIQCNCEIKCSNLFSVNQKQELFKQYNSLRSHEEQHLFLKSLVMPSTNSRKFGKNLIIF